MKMVVAYIRHEAFEPIRTELLELGFPSLSISEVKGSGRQKGITERYRGAELTNYLRLHPHDDVRRVGIDSLTAELQQLGPSVCEVGDALDALA